MQSASLREVFRSRFPLWKRRGFTACPANAFIIAGGLSNSGLLGGGKKGIGRPVDEQHMSRARRPAGGNCKMTMDENRGKWKWNGQCC